MCEYCENQKELKEKEFDVTIVNNCLVVGNQCSCGYDRARFNINYCPMCGRKLDVLNEEEFWDEFIKEQERLRKEE